MKLHAKKRTLTKALAACKEVVDKRSSMPILECVMISITKNKASCHVNDLETALIFPLETLGKQVDGTVVVKLNDLAKTVKAMDGNIILYSSYKITAI